MEFGNWEVKGLRSGPVKRALGWRRVRLDRSRVHVHVHVPVKSLSPTSLTIPRTEA